MIFLLKFSSWIPDPAELSLKQGFTNIYLGKRKLAVRQHFQFFRNNKGFGAVLSLQNEMKMLHNYLWKPKHIREDQLRVLASLIIWEFSYGWTDSGLSLLWFSSGICTFIFCISEKSINFSDVIICSWYGNIPIIFVSKNDHSSKIFVFQAFFFHPYWGLSQEMSPFRPVLTVTYYSTLYCCHNIKQPRPSFG